MPTVLQTRRTLTPNLAPPNLSLAEGELAVELATAPNPKLWVGVPSTIDASGKRLVADLSQGGGVTISDTPPTPITNGALWWDSGYDLQLYVGYDDGTSLQWVAANNPPSPPPPQQPVIVSDAPPTVEDGALWWDSGASLQLYVGYDDGTSLQWVVASSGTTTGGPYLPLSGGTLTGALTVGGVLNVSGQLNLNTDPGVINAGIIVAENRTADGSVTIDFIATPGKISDFRIMRNAGLNGNASIQLGGTGLMTLMTNGVNQAVIGIAGGGSTGIGFEVLQGFTARGILCRPGIDGAAGANQYNIFWNNTAPEFWVDNVNVGTLTITSDYRVKDNVADLPPMWDKVKALHPVSYTIKNNEELFTKTNPIEQWGFLAHELQETLTEAAATGQKDASNIVQSPNVMVLLAPIVSALQEAMARIETLEPALNEATAKIAVLESSPGNIKP